ncbi:MAG: malectin [Verrucomicrobiota bacterium]
MKSLRLPTLLAALAALTLAGCQSGSSTSSMPAAPAASAPAASAPSTKPAPKMTAIRIKAGPPVAGFTADADGNVWLPERGFTGTDSIGRDGLAIANTKSPGIYQSEHYSMTAFSEPLPNGKYTVKLHFSETYEGITGPGQRVFTFNIEGKEFKDFDIWVKAGGFARAYIETVEVEVKDGKLDITFTPQVENPQINGIEIIPHG